MVRVEKGWKKDKKREASERERNCKREREGGRERKTDRQIEIYNR